MVSESAKSATKKYIHANWESKYKDYYCNKKGEWINENRSKYNEYLRQYMANKYAYNKEVKRLNQICIC